MTIEEMKHSIMNEFKTKGCMPGDGMPTAYWNSALLQNADADIRILFDLAVKDMIAEGYLSDKPIQTNKSPLGSLKKGLWLVKYL